MGGMAEVYLARHRGAAGFQKLVVIKRVLPHLAVDTDFVEMFLKEARLAAALDHPNIAQVTDFGHDGSDYYMVLEWVQGHDLRAVIKAAVAQRGALPLDMALGITCDVATALHYAHEQHDGHGRPLGIVHRDVSPSNVLLASTGAVKVIDFGIARAVGVSRTTRAGVVKGKAGYMSPEQCRDDALDRRTDVFGLGILLYEMTTGYRLFHASNDFAAMNKITEGRYVVPTEAVEDYPAALETIVLRCLALDPADRYPTGDALRADLEAFALERRLSLSATSRASHIERWLGPPTAPPLPASVTEVAATPSSLPPASPSITAPGHSAPSQLPTRTLATRPARRSNLMLVALTAGVTAVGVWGLTRLTNTPAAASTPPSAATTSRSPAPVTAPPSGETKADDATLPDGHQTPSATPEDTTPTSAVQPQPAAPTDEPAANPTEAPRPASRRRSPRPSRPKTQPTKSAPSTKPEPTKPEPAKSRPPLRPPSHEEGP